MLLNLSLHELVVAMSVLAQTHVDVLRFLRVASLSCSPLFLHVQYVVLLKEEIVRIAVEYQKKGLAVVAISSNSTQTHPQDGPDNMAEDAKQLGYTFAYLYDETQVCWRNDAALAGGAWKLGFWAWIGHLN